MRFLALVLLLAPFALCADEDGWTGLNPRRSHVAVGRLFWQADYSKGMDLFSVERKDGAEGSVSIVDLPGGKKGLRVVKSNDIGYISISPRIPFAVKKGSELQARASVSGDSNDPNYAVGMLRMYGKSRNYFYFSGLDGRGAGGPKMDFLHNAPVESPERKLCRYLASEQYGTNVTPAIVVAGARSDSVWCDWCVEDLVEAKRKWRDFLKKTEPADKSGDMQDAATFAAGLAADVEHTAKVVKENGRSVLKIDGRTVPPIVFKGKIAQRDKNLYCGKKMEENGVKVQTVTVRFGDAPSSPGFWTASGFDAAGAAASVRSAMRMAPKSLFFLTLIVDAYPEFSDEHPDEVWRTADGKIVWGNQVHANYFFDRSKYRSRHWPWISNHSVVWREAVKRNITALVEQLKKEGLSKRIVGVHLGGYHDHQFSTRHMDCSKPAIAAFREWQKRKYGKVKWQDAPAFSKDVTYFTPERDQAQIDFYTFLKVGPFEMQENLARHIKRSFGKDIVTLRWCMAAFGGTYGSAYDITAFARSNDFDILVAQPSYGHRTPGASIGIRLPDASFHENGKLFMNEFDIRTYGAVSGGETELRVTGLSQAVDFPMWQTIYRKLAGQMLAERMGWWFYDMAGGWFEPPEIAADIGEVMKTVDSLSVAKPSAWTPSVAFVIDEEGALLRNTPASYYNHDEQMLFGEQLRLLAASGVPCDVWLADDLIRNPAIAERYRMVVFAGMYHIDSSRKAMLRRVKRGGRTIVFLSGTGAVGGSEETGFDVIQQEAPQSHVIVQSEGEDVNVSSFTDQWLLTRYLGCGSLGKGWQPRRTTVTEGDGVHVVARFAKGGVPAIAEKQFKGWKSVIVGSAAGLTPQYFSRLARRSGCYVPVSCGMQVNMNGDFVSVHCLVPGVYDFVLPFRCNVRNLKNGKVFADVKSVKLDMSAGETRWFTLEKVR